MYIFNVLINTINFLVTQHNMNEFYYRKVISDI